MPTTRKLVRSCLSLILSLILSLTNHVVLLPLRLAHSQHGPGLRGPLVPPREQPVRERTRKEREIESENGSFNALASLGNLDLSKKNPQKKSKTSNSRWSERMKAEDLGYFDRLKNQQAPKYLWIGCADSRVPVRRVFLFFDGFQAAFSPFRRWRSFFLLDPKGFLFFLSILISSFSLPLARYS